MFFVKKFQSKKILSFSGMKEILTFNNSYDCKKYFGILKKIMEDF